MNKQNDNSFSQTVLKFLSRSHVSTFRQIPINERSEEEEQKVDQTALNMQAMQN